MVRPPDDFPTARQLQSLWRSHMALSRFPATKAQWKQRQRRTAGLLDHLLQAKGDMERVRVSLIADTVKAVEGWRPGASTVREWLKLEDARFQKTRRNRNRIQ